MKIFILDTGDAFTTDRFNTCFIVQDKNGINLAIECPHPYMKILKHNSREGFPTLSEINHVLVTHVHSDHFGGLEMLTFYKKYVENKRVGLYINRDHWEHAKSILAPTMCSIFNGKDHYIVPVSDYFNTVMMKPNEKCVFGDFNIEIYKTKHYIPSCAVMIREGDASVAYSGDTMFDPELIKWMDQADLIIHEVGVSPGHTSYSDLYDLPERIKDKIRLIHYSDNFGVETSRIQCLRAGDIIERVWNLR